MLPIPYRIGLFDNVGPRSSRCTSDDGAVCHVRSDYFELGAIPAVQDGTLVHSLRVWINGGVVPPVRVIDAQGFVHHLIQERHAYRVTSYPTGKMYCSV